MSIAFCPLRSGSSGNSLFVSAGGANLLLDAGLSGKTVEEALRAAGGDPTQLCGILVSHEHSDHIKGVGVLSRRYDLPVYATEKTWLAMENKPGMQNIALKNRRVFTANESFYIRNLAVTPFSIPHDAADPVGFALESDGRKLCVATDLGHIAKGWMTAVSGADLLLLESNHDPDMLFASERYTSALKARIYGTRGHLSNDDCGKALVRLAETGVRNVILGHLSQETNNPELAFNTVCRTLCDNGIKPQEDLRVDLAWRDRMGGYYEIG